MYCSGLWFTATEPIADTYSVKLRKYPNRPETPLWHVSLSIGLRWSQQLRLSSAWANGARRPSGRCRRRAASTIKRADTSTRKFNPILGEKVEQLQYWIVMHETKAEPPPRQSWLSGRRSGASRRAVGFHPP